MTYYGDYGSLIQYLIVGIILFIFSIVFCIFSPFGIFFIVFSIIRAKTQGQTLKTVSLIFQIILASLTLVTGFLIGLLFLIRGSPFYTYSGGWVLTLAVIMGVFLVVAIEVGVILWQTSLANRKEISLSSKRK